MPDANPNPLLPAGLVIDHYEIVRHLGSGGMATVYLARDLELGRRVALKLIGSPSAPIQNTTLFKNEARTLAQFSHPNIVGVFGVGDFAAQAYIAMELVEGDTLRHRMETDDLSLREIQRLALGIAHGLAEAHRRNVIHGDLKPENMMIAKDGRLRVLDFGLARLMGEPRDAVVQGTPSYMAPELWQGHERTFAIDVWAFGVILYELICGRRPFERTAMADLSEVITADTPSPSIRGMSSLPEGLVDLVDRCLAKDPNKRPAASELVASFSRVVHGFEATKYSAQDAPFRGLAAFTEAQASFFFGREPEIAAFIERLRTEVVLPVVGASGVGKSSFIQAGVIPRLKEKGEWRVLRVRPGTDPFRTLASRLTKLPSSDRTVRQEDTGVTPRLENDPIRLAAILADKPKSLALELRRYAKQNECSVLLLVDQLEEICTLVTDEDTRFRFLAAVCNAADDPSDPIRVVFTVRDDFLSRLAESDDAQKALSNVAVLRAPGPAALREILQRPLETIGYRYDDDALAEDMIAAVKNEASALPLLQFCGAMLWERRNPSDKTLQRSAYSAIGGVQGALATHADLFLRDLSEAETRLIGATLLRLVTPEGTRRVVSRRVLVEALGPGVEAALLRLTTARLLAVHDVFDEVHYELSHESLVHNWRQLTRWLEEGREELLFLSELEQAAAVWLKRGRRPVDVWTGVKLHEAERTLHRTGSKLPQTSQHFLLASRQADERRRAVKRWLITAAAAALVIIAVVSVITAISFREKSRVATEQSAAAQAEGARSAYQRGDYVTAKAQLRSSFAQVDSALARALLVQLERDPIEWKRTLPAMIYDVDAVGGTIAVAGLDHTVYLLDRKTAALTSLRGAEDQVTGIAVAPDEQTVVSGEMSGVVSMWTLASKTRVVLGTHAGPAWKLTYSHDGHYVVSAGFGGEVKLWDLRQKREAKRWLIEGQNYRAIFNADDTRIVVGSSRGAIVWLDPKNDTPVATWEKAHAAPVMALAFAGARLVSGAEDGNIAIWEKETAQRRFHAHDAAITDMVADGDRLWSVSYDATLREWNLATGTATAAPKRHDAGLTGLALLGPSTLVSASMNDTRVTVWNLLASGAAQHTSGHDAPVQCVRFSSDGQHIFSASDDKRAIMWNAATGEEERSFLGATDQLGTLEASATRLFTGSADKQIREYDLTSGDLLHVLTGHQNAIQALGAGTVLSSTGMDATLRQWADGALIRTLQLGTPVAAARFRKNIAVLSTLSDGHFMIALDPLRVLQRGKAYGWGVAIAPDEQRYVIGTDEGDAVLHDKQGRVLSSAHMTSAGLRNGAFHPDGQRVGFGAVDEGRIWNVNDPTRVVSLRGHLGEVSDLTFDPAGRRAVTAGDDGTVRLWNVETGEPLWYARAFLPPDRVLTHRGWQGESKEDALMLMHSLRDVRWAEGHGQNACIVSNKGSLQLWTNNQLIDVPISHVNALMALPSGCLVLTNSDLLVTNWTGQNTKLPVDAKTVRVMTNEQDSIAYATSNHMIADGRSLAIDPNPTAIGLGDDWLAAGYGNGSVDLFDRQTHARLAFSLQEQPAGAVTHILRGPMQSVIVAYSSGTVGVWSRKDNSKLMHAKLHGAIKVMRVIEGSLVMVSTLGDVASLDLQVLSASYCDIWPRLATGMACPN